MDDKVDAFLDKLVALGGELVDAAKPAAEVAVEATLAAVHMRGIAAMVTVAVALVIGACGVVAANRLRKHAAIVREKRKSDWHDDHVPWYIGAFIAGVGSCVAVAVAVVTLTSAYTWMALLRPDAYLAAKALGL